MNIKVVIGVFTYLICTNEFVDHYAVYKLGFWDRYMDESISLHIIGLAIISLILSEYMRKNGWIQFDDKKTVLEEKENENA